MSDDPRRSELTGDFPRQAQKQPGDTAPMRPQPDHGEETYRGHGRLAGRRALITGGDSGIGRAVALAYAREGADVAIACLPDDRADAEVTAGLVEGEGRRALTLLGDVRDESFAGALPGRTADAFGGLDILVLNAGYQRDRDGVETIDTDDMDRVFRTNLYGMIWTARAAVPLLQPGASIIVTASIQAFQPSPELFDYAMTKAAQVSFVRSIAQELGPRGIRVNAVAPGPIWTPLIPATGFDPEKLESFGSDTPLGRAGQPAELAGVYVFLASDDASYVSGGVFPVTGGKHL